jgi:hypothetical protein
LLAPTRLALPDRWASSEHCRIEHVGTSDVVLDDGSRNGTLVNGERVERYRVLTDGDLLCLSSPDLSFDKTVAFRFRAYDADSGKVIWEVDTTKPVAGVNGIEGHGGAMSGAGATVARGHVIVNSGYGLYYHMPGNLLMVFAPAK